MKFERLGMILLIIGFIALMISMSISGVNMGLSTLGDMLDEEDADVKRRRQQDGES